jgi:hypothetical protein
VIFPLSTRSLHSTPIPDLQQAAGTTTTTTTLPALEDNKYLKAHLHRDNNIPFNTLRDVVGIPVFSREEQDYCHQAWLDYCMMHDVEILQDEIFRKEATPHDFWTNSLKIVIQTPHFLPPLSRLLEDPEMVKLLKVPGDYPERLICMLFYHEKHDYAKTLIDRFLSSRSDINWKLMLQVCLVSENNTALEIFSKIYVESPKKDGPYCSIMDSLRELHLKENFVNRWSNRLISCGGLSDIKSDSLNADLNSKLDSMNLKSFESCLLTLSKEPKAKTWLSEETALLFARYVTSYPDKQQETVLRRTLIQFHDQNFAVSFWTQIYRTSKINIEVLDSLSQGSSGDKGPSSKEENELIKSKAKHLVVQNDQKRFWRFVEEETKDNNQLLVKLSPEMLTMKIRDSNNLHQALEFAKHVIKSSIGKSKNQQALIKLFIIEATHAITSRKLFHHTKVMDRFENFLLIEGLLDSKIHNYFIYYELQVLKLKSAVKRLRSLSEISEPSISVQTIDSVVSSLFRNVKLLEKQNVFPVRENSVDPIQFQILELIFHCHPHCVTDFKPITWGRILDNIVETFKFEQARPFLIKIRNFIVENNEAMKNVHPSNPTYPLRIAFSDQLIRKIIHRGFIESSENPWQGYEFVRELEKSGVFVSETILKGHLMKYIKTLHGLPGVKRKWRRLSAEREKPITDVESTVEKLNQIYLS